MQIQTFHRSYSEYYDLKRRLVTYVMVVTISFNEICLTDMLIGQMKAFVMDAVVY